ncbi:MAG: trypsin-like peptidase domain-containing protein [Taibaiella sp.]|nr:trypsin-like peptidase domain-containing protein [Taibaiella sp.]
MQDGNHIWAIAEEYVAGTITEAAGAELSNRLQTDVEFAASFNECVNLLRSMKGAATQAHFRGTLKDAAQKHNAARKTIPLRTHYWRTGAIAAGVALLTSACAFLSFSTHNKSNTNQYSVLRHEIENIKRSQTQIIRNINRQNAAGNTPTAAVKYSGTGFALNNEGYLVTNYHVVDGADSVYIQNQKGDYYKAIVKAFDPNTDIAVLKVEDEHFRFAKGDVPYTFTQGKTGLGAHIYTVGYPDDDMVYNEGYISANNGYQEDSMQYRMELPADPGQSGAPVLDASGNVMAIVTAKGNQSGGSTYAVSSKALLQLLHSMPADERISLPHTNRMGRLDREMQIQKLAQYTCSVKVYKK